MAGGERGTPSWLGEPPKVAESEITETLETEVLVVGCRTGGLPAAISAAEYGAQVLGIGRTSDVLNPREDIGGIDSRLQKASFEEFPQFEIDKMEAMEDIVRYANGFVDYNPEKYNADARAGKDSDYNKEAYRLMELKTPPYYGMRTGAWFLATLDGVRINTDMHPYREDGSIIEGLYLTGNDSGGFFSVSYPNLFTGLACGRTMLFGRIAGKNAATGAA